MESGLEFESAGLFQLHENFREVVAFFKTDALPHYLALTGGK